jgi:hypothetical protein
MPNGTIIIRRKVLHPFKATGIVMVLNVYDLYVFRADTGRQITRSHTYTYHKSHSVYRGGSGLQNHLTSLDCSVHIELVELYRVREFT